MSDEVLKRLERIEAQLRELTASVQTLTRTAEGSPTDNADPVPVALAETSPKAKEAQIPPTSEPKAAVPEAPYAELLTQLFEAALAIRPEACWEGLETLTHSDDLQAPRAVDHLRAFNWKRFRATAGSYLTEDVADSWVVARSVPEVIDDDTATVKVYLERAGANPAPVSIAREGGAQGPWRVRNLSL
ncbi:MAG: hypothetical protein VYE15_03575 [Myxococcota bacterium]|nr:hypothetical protein [Myxococcota bacterium]